MKQNITHNSSQELILVTLNTEPLWKVLEQSFAEFDLGLIKRKLIESFTYTGEQMAAFESEWELMYNDWYWENAPTE